MNPLYARLDPNSSIDDIRVLIADLEEKKEEKKEPENEEGIEEVEDPVNQQKFVDYELSIDQLSDYISKFQYQQDKAWLQQIKSEATNSIDSYTKAYDASILYSKGWFSRLFLSVEAKVDLAGYLLGVLQPFCKSNLDTLTMIYNRDPDIILYISYPRSDEE